MNYPAWILSNIDVGLLVALIAIPHVYIAHLAVGGGLFLVLTEGLAYRRKDNKLLDYVKRHTWFFLLLTMVFGGITGVGIWFVIQLAQPAATSKLIHEFVFGWATEWVFFIVEIWALLIYHYLFNKLKPRAHLNIGWIYFAAAWLSMVIIHGILSFMLTPGRWLETGNFWHGFFNPGYWPGLVFRSAMALTIAGLFGLVTAVRTKDEELRSFLSRYCAIWVVVPFIVMILGGFWYFNVSNAELGGEMLKGYYFVDHFNSGLVLSSVVIFIGGMLMLIRWPKAISGVLVTLLVIIGLGWMGSFEYIRENARRPWIIQDYMYSNGVLASDVERLNENGFLSEAVWARTDTDEHKAEDLYVHQCLVCHTWDGHRDLKSRTAKFSRFGMLSQLTGQGKVQAYMPPFIGTEEEKELLAEHIVGRLHGKPQAETSGRELDYRDDPVEQRELAEGDYVILAWNKNGIQCYSKGAGRFSIGTTGNLIFAQLIRRGDLPEIVREDVTLSYKVEGAEMAGEFGPHGDHAFVTEPVHLTPLNTGGSFNPYPWVTVTASVGGETVATTRVTVPNSTEVGCGACHGGPWDIETADIPMAVAEDVLATHDRLSGTSLLDSEARACNSCHGNEDNPQLMSLSAALHGFHANYLSNYEDATPCVSCHPASEESATRCFRGRHAMSFDCTACHGAIADHALSLLKQEKQAGKPGADRLMRHLDTVLIESVEAVNPRKPWSQEPDCLNCHEDFTLSKFEAFNNWTANDDELFRLREDDNGIRCSACHHTPHAVFVADNAWGSAIDNYQSLRYMGDTGTIGGLGNCTVCHVTPPEVNGHHPNALR